ncbi:MAG: hypothetical protein QOI69_3170 [Pseudonocardiales bacterium]|nr:hypothetical protein [Pseudonocardiales bacterium]
MSFADLRTATRPAAAPGLLHTYFGWIRIGGYLHVVGFVLAIAARVVVLRSARRSAQ